MYTALIADVELRSPAGAILQRRWTDMAIRPDPDGTAYVQRLLEPPVLETQLTADMTRLSSGRSGGTMVLMNTDGALDGFRTHTWQAVRLWEATVGPDFAIISRRDLGRARCGRAEWRPSTLTAPARVAVPLIDEAAALDTPLTVARLAGTGGLEGGTDLAGRARPLLFGRVPDQMPGVLVRPTDLTYMVGHPPTGQAALATSPALTVQDRGAPAGLAFAGHATGAAFDSATLAPASYLVDPQRGLVKVTSGLPGPVTFGADAAAGITAAAVIADLWARAMPGETAPVPVPALAASLAGALARVTGLSVSSDVTPRTVLDLVLASAGCGLAGRAPDGTWYLAPVVGAPEAAASPVVLDSADVLSVEAESGQPAPVGEVTVAWGRIERTVTGSDLLPSLVATAEEERLRVPWREVTARHAATVSAAPDWRSIRVETALRDKAAAEALAADVLAGLCLRPSGAARQALRIAMLQTADHGVLGGTVQLDWPGLSGVYRVTGVRAPAPRAGFKTVMVWG